MGEDAAVQAAAVGSVIQAGDSAESATSGRSADEVVAPSLEDVEVGGVEQVPGPPSGLSPPAPPLVGETGKAEGCCGGQGADGGCCRGD